MYNLIKANDKYNKQLIYYNLDNFIKDVPDTVDYMKISVNHIGDKRRLDIDCVKGYMYSYRIYLDDYFYMGLFNLIDIQFGGGFSTNSNCLYGNVVRESKNQIMHNIKARMSELKKFKLPTDIDVKDCLTVMGWDDITWASKYIKPETKTKTRKPRTKKEGK